MTESFRRPASPLKCRLVTDRHSEKRPFARALATATWGRCEQIAARVHRSGRLVRAWENPEDPQLPPNQVLAEVMQAAMVAGATEEEALAPLAHLAQLFGRELAFRAAPERANGVVESVAVAVEKVGVGFATTLRAACDGRITPAELEQVDAALNGGVVEIRRVQSEARARAAQAS